MTREIARRVASVLVVVLLGLAKDAGDAVKEEAESLKEKAK